ncbi:hypothetical protein [Cupriavidus gilardii]|uniref:hypothetical protein n=1 Tax=Cupriavidus gilardii TaxID=82541 RepID=UPI001580B334|nr:hypothetical protein [Cupriavidus gilardii]MCT9074085.1 hypothetical protein [Cupriavidus gilardii]QKS61836.1 hypothetical protein FOB47_08400 [Cupriavidus gilardii]
MVGIEEYRGRQHPARGLSMLHRRTRILRFMPPSADIENRLSDGRAVAHQADLAASSLRQNRGHYPALQYNSIGLPPG